jgi:hypothetical protein
LWAVAIAINHSRQQQKTVAAFAIVEFLAGVCFPFFLVAGTLLIANVIDFITGEAVDSHKALPRLLNAIKFEKGDKQDYWIIETDFYFPVKKREGKHFTCFPSFATWILVVITSLAFIFAMSYFVNIVLDMQVSVEDCNDPRIDRTFSCFNSSTLDYVDCVTNTTVNGIIHCFKFFQFGVDVDIVQSIGSAYAVYLVATASFGHIFLVRSIFWTLATGRVWDVLQIVLGVIFLIVSIVVIVVWLNGYISETAEELTRLNVIHLAQFVMVSLFLLLTGLLMVGGKWAKKSKKPKQS